MSFATLFTRMAVGEVKRLLSDFPDDVCQSLLGL